MEQTLNVQCIPFSLWFTKDFVAFQSEPLKGKVERILHWRYVNLPVEGEIIDFLGCMILVTTVEQFSK